jgi:anti-sigma factor RsiW
MNTESKTRHPCRHHLGTMLPWYVNGTLGPQETRAFRRHLEECAACRVEADAHIAMRSEMAASAERMPDPLVSLERLMSRISSVEHGSFRGWRRPKVPAGARVLAGVLVVQAVVILVLAVALVVLLARPQPAADYYTLGSPAAGQQQNEMLVHLVLEESLGAAEFHAILEESAARVIAGPDDSGGYLVGVAVGDAGGEAAARDLVQQLATRPGIARATLINPVPAP